MKKLFNPTMMIRPSYGRTCFSQGLTLAGVLLGLCLASAQPTIIDYGPDDPSPGPDDIAQLTWDAANADGLNYYFDNASPPGQIFTTGTNPNGYTLNSVLIHMADNAGGLPAGGQSYVLRIYGVAGSTATLLRTYTSQGAFTYQSSDWLQCTNLGMTLLANSQYAYSFARSSSGWERLGNVGGNPYSGGEIALIPTGGGTMTLGTTHAFDGTFVVGLTPVTVLTVTTPTISPSAAVPAGTNATISVTAAGPAPYYYQWQTDGGSGVALTNIPGATSSSLVVDTSRLVAPGAFRYAVVVTNSTSSVTSDIVTLAVINPPAAATLTSLGATSSPGVNDITQFIGGGDRDGLNYYDDNGPNHDGWTGQTFTTGTNSQGYYLTSVAFQTGGGGSDSVNVVQPYHLYLYSVAADGVTTTLLAHYTNAAFSFVDGDWLKWSGFSVPLKANQMYAYAFGRDSRGSGWEALAVSPTNTDLYTDGQMCLISSGGGLITPGASGMSDAVFDLGLLPIGIGPDPKPFAGTIQVDPARTVTAGTQVTLSQAATGQAPLSFQWRTDGGSGGALTNVPSATGTNLVLNTSGWKPAAYRFDFIVANSFGSSPAAVATVSVIYTNASAVITDIGLGTPSPVATDITQTVLPSGANNPDGMNYYFDNGSPPGQTFTTGSNPSGYVVNSVAIKLAGNSGGLPAEGQPYVLRFYSVAGSTATPYAIYTSQDAFTYSTADWVRFSGFFLPLSPNSTYAYSMARSASGSGWENLGNVSGDPYTAGEAVLIQPAGGSITFGSSHAYDATFIIGLALQDHPAVMPPVIAPTNSIYAATIVSLTTTVSGVGPFTYQWLTDGGNTAGGLTNIPGATGATLQVDTTGLDNRSIAYAVRVTGAGGSTTSEQSILVVQSASAPVIAIDTTPSTLTTFVGGSVTFTASFLGTLPISYQWQVDHGTGAGPVSIPGQTNETLTLGNVQLADAGSYSLVATNMFGPNTSAPSTLTVLPQPLQPFTVNFQWHSTEDGKDVGNYAGSGVPGFGTGTYWNQVTGPSSWSPGTYSSTTGLTDGGVTESGLAWTLVTGGSWDWVTAPANPLLNSSASAYAVQPFTFRLPNGLYNIVLFSCNGTEASSQQNGGAVFTINGVTQTALPTQNTNFVQGNTYVVFHNVAVTGATLSGTWEPAPGKSYGSLNGAQVQFTGPAVTISAQRLVNGKVQLQWPMGTLLESSSLSGPWTTNSAPSPATIDPAGPLKFYRVIVR